MKLWTAQLSYAGPYRLDITVKGMDPVGRVFAPTWDMVMSHKKTGDDLVYIEAYRALMLESYKNHRDVWDEVLSRDNLVIVCFCGPKKFCHRHILREYFTKMGAEYQGEINLSGKPIQPEQKPFWEFSVVQRGKIYRVIRTLGEKKWEHFFEFKALAVAKATVDKMLGVKEFNPKHWAQI